MSNNEDATTNATGTGGAGNATGRNGGGTTANAVAAAARPAAARRRPNDSTHQPLTGKNEYIKPIVESQRATLGNIMATTSLAMLATHEEILGRGEAALRWKGTYHDQFDLDNDGKRKEKPYIPNSLRKLPCPLNVSQSIVNDSRFASDATEILANEVKAKATYEAYKVAMAEHFKVNASLNQKAARELHSLQYIDMVHKIAKGFAIERKAKQIPKTTLDAPTIAFIVAKDALRELPKKHYMELGFLDVDGDNDEEDMAEVEKFWKKYQKILSFDYDGKIHEKRTVGDEPLFKSAKEDLVRIVPELTTKFWAHLKEQEEEREINAALREEFAKCEIDEANNALADQMEVDGEKAVEAISRKTAEQTVDRRLAQAKGRARKNYSGGAADQEPTPESNGEKQKRNSKQKRGNGEKRSQKKSRRNYDDEGSYDEREQPKGRRERGRQRGKQTRGILRSPSVTWSQAESPEPARARYSTPQRKRGASYHGSRDRGGRRKGDHDDKGSRGGQRKGGKSKNGKRR